MKLCSCSMCEVERLSRRVGVLKRAVRRDDLSDERRAAFVAEIEIVQEELTRQQRRVRRLLGIDPIVP